MTEFKTFDGESRSPTWGEREQLKAMSAEGIEDVYVAPDSAPSGFWVTIEQATYRHILPAGVRSEWIEWEGELSFATGRDFAGTHGRELYETIVKNGFMPLTSETRKATAGERLSAIEHLLDSHGTAAVFQDLVNDRARWFRIGLRLEGKRFVPVMSEHLHTEVVQPTLVLLSAEKYQAVDALYRKGFERALSGDPSGAITASISAVEEMLRILLPQMKHQTLSPLAEKARAEGLISSAVEDFVKKLYGLRPESDAHAIGTREFEVAMLALHLSGSLLMYIGSRS